MQESGFRPRRGGLRSCLLAALLAVASGGLGIESVCAAGATDIYRYQGPDRERRIVDGKREAAGWAPHRDIGHKSLIDDRRPKSITIWLPLTDATPQNMLTIDTADDPSFRWQNEAAKILAHKGKDLVFINFELATYPDAVKRKREGQRMQCV